MTHRILCALCNLPYLPCEVEIRAALAGALWEFEVADEPIAAALGELLATCTRDADHIGLWCPEHGPVWEA